MAIIIRNMSEHDGSEHLSVYTVRINNDPVIATFGHFRPDGLAECLRLAAMAVDAALPASDQSEA